MSGGLPADSLGPMWIVVAVALASILVPLNSTMVAVALPRLMADLGVSLGAATWLITSYLIAMASLQPLAGKLGDRYGRRRLILGGLLYFGLASLGAATATSFAELLLFRVNQAISGAIVFPNAAALVREVVPVERRASAYGLVGTAVALGAAAGPLLGGLLIELLGWRAIFYASAPLVLAALLVGWLVVPRRESADSTLTSGADVRPTFLGLFRVRAFAAASAAVGLSNLAMYVTVLALPLLSAVSARTSLETGLLLAALLGPWVVCASWGGRLADRLGRRRIAVAGLTLLALGLLPLALGIHRLTGAALLGALVLAGLGLGLSAAPVQTSAVEAVGPRDAGVAAGVFATSRYLGSIVGSVLLAPLLGAGDGAAAFTGVFGLAFAAALLAIVAGLGLRDRAPDAPAPGGRPIDTLPVAA
jgi:MFS family permease